MRSTSNPRNAKDTNTLKNDRILNMSVLAKVFMFVVLVLGVVGFITMLAMIEQNNAPIDATVKNTTAAYYDAQQQVNKSINQTMQYGRASGIFLSPLPILIMIFVFACAFLLFMTVVKKR